MKRALFTMACLLCAGMVFAQQPGSESRENPQLDRKENGGIPAGLTEGSQARPRPNGQRGQRPEGWREGQRPEGWKDGQRPEGWKEGQRPEGWREGQRPEGWKNGQHRGRHFGDFAQMKIDSAKVAKFTPVSGKNVNYREVALNMDKAGKPVLVVYLHGMGGSGNDNISQMRQGGIYKIYDYLVAKKIKAYFIIPQCPRDYTWTGSRDKGEYNSVLAPIIKKYIKEKGIDPKRVYITGASSGGSGVWRMIADHPKVYAAALIASGSTRGLSTQQLYDTPVYVTMGTLENPERAQRLRDFVSELADNACDATFEYLEGKEHGPATVEAFSEERLNWLFSKTK